MDILAFELKFDEAQYHQRTDPSAILVLQSSIILVEITYYLVLAYCNHRGNEIQGERKALT